ncbi:MAG: hypothetical protein K9J85_10880 [Desulfobacteraceae bacterium]|nr:hypothetical protein [Desulfobacteraceae bacterium]
MNFKVKIFIAAIGILLSALVLNSILSISFFEDIYSRSLTSVLESAGKNLQQRIQRGIRLGKPLDAYEGMSERLEHFLQDNPRAASVAVSNANGDILYFVDKNSSSRDMLSGHASRHLPVTETVTYLRDDNYLIYVPLFKKDSLPVGAVLVSISRQEVMDKVGEMITGALARLGWTLVPTALVLVLILGLFVVRPIKKDLDRIRRSLLPYMGQQPEKQQSHERRNPGSPAGEGWDRQDQGLACWLPTNAQKPGQQHIYDFRRVRNEIRQLGIFLHAVAQEIRSDIRHFQNINQSVSELEKIRADLEECRSILMSFLHDAYAAQAFKNDLEDFLQENQRVLALIDELLYAKQRPTV